MVEKINGSNQQQTGFSTNYQNQQDNLAAKIKENPNGVDELKENAKIKKQQINLARQNGDNELVKTLQAELQEIENDINKNSSIF
ncbi:hypothetical protein IJ843_08610 [bacterium]|nr:hypothetical protein [bacterium]